jgi:hypothetical protein
MVSAQTTSDGAGSERFVEDVGREKKLSGGGERPGAKEGLGFGAFSGERSRTRIPCPCSCTEEGDSDREAWLGGEKGQAVLGRYLG